MDVKDALIFCQSILSQYGNIEVVVFTENPEKYNCIFYEPIFELLAIHASRFSDKKKLVTGIGFGEELNFLEDDQIKTAIKRKTFLRIIK